MLCFGVWGTVGSTGRWPEVVNLWELERLGRPGRELRARARVAVVAGSGACAVVGGSRPNCGAAASTGSSCPNRGARPSRSSPLRACAAWCTRTRSCAFRSARCARSWRRSPRSVCRRSSRSASRCVGAYRVAMNNDSEAIVIWALPSWEAWGHFEQAWDGSQLAAWRARLVTLNADVRRTLIGRRAAQPDAHRPPAPGRGSSPAR